MSLTGTRLVDWIVLRRVCEGGVAIYGSEYVDHGRRVPCYLPEAFRRLADAELTDLLDADYPGGMRRVVITTRGQVRCLAPCECCAVEPELAGESPWMPVRLAAIMVRVGDRWDGAPPEEAYGRVSDPGRYAALYAVGQHLLDELESRFAVNRETFSEPDQHGTEPATAVRLVPVDPAAAELTIVFDAFPGLRVRMGRDDSMHLPVCGCDACDETVEECTEQLRRRLDALTAGTFGERLVREQGWWHEHWYRTVDGASGRSRTPVDDDQLDELRAAMPDGELSWAPWPKASPCEWRWSL